MKKLLFTVALIAGSILAHAQVSYEQYQGRSIEPLQDTYVRPVVADLEMISLVRKSYGGAEGYLFFEGVDVSKLSEAHIENAKISAVYKASAEDNADMIIGTTFEVTSPKKGGGILVKVQGYPAKYAHWRKLGSGDDPEADYQWLTKGLFIGSQIRQSTGKSGDREAKQK